MQVFLTPFSSPTRRRRAPRRAAPRRGRAVALLLTLLALAFALILAMGFLAAQGTSVGMAKNVNRQSVARAIAETGLYMGLSHVRNDATWRTDNADGVWVNAMPLYGGTLTLSGQDGFYNPVTGTIVGTGSLTTNYSDLAILTAVGTFQGVTETMHLQVTPVGTSASLPGALCTASTVNLSGSGMIDGFNSANGGYGGSNVIDNKVTVTTNSTASGAITMSGGAKLNGNVEIGPGGSTATAVNVPTWATFITGTQSALTSAVGMTMPTAPSGTGTASGALSVANNNTQTISSNCHYTSLTVTNSGILRISGNVTMQIDGSAIVEGAGQLVIEPGSSLTLAIGGSFTVTNSGQVNMTTNNPSVLLVSLLTSGQGMTVSGAGGIYATVTMPGGQLYVTGSGNFYGTAVAGSFAADGGSGIHLDVNPKAAVPGSSGSGPTTYTYTPDYVDQP